MSAELDSDLRLEIAHILFIDVVGYSKLLINDQHQIMHRLNRAVRESPQFREADAADKLVRLPTGDGMALIFSTTPEAPAQCAMEISEALRDGPPIPLRMGIHSGPVNPITDVNDRTNIAGAGINMAQRVMDCADAGHILLSKHVAEDLAHYRKWQPLLHDLGECQVKHDVSLPLVNLYTDGIGNPELPRKLKEQVAARQRKRRNFSVAIATSLALAGVVAFLLVHQLTAKALEKSIAVLPFEYLSEDKQNSYFADGVQDDILADLAKVADLKVISRRSVAQYRGSTKPIREIAQALGVSYILEGSVAKVADRIHVTAELIDGRTEAQTWAEKYDRQLADVFAIQSEIAQTIVSRLKAALSPTEKASIEQRPTQDMQAYDLYLRAKGLLYATDMITDPKAEENLKTAVDLLNKAVARDSRFALAYCLLVDTNLNLYLDSLTASYLEAAEAAVQAASRLAPDAGETHLAHAVFFYRRHRDYDHALEQLELAAQSLPNSVDVALLSAQIERRLGRWTESVRHFIKASELDPRDSRIRSEVVRTLGMTRRYSDALRAADRAIADFPEKADIFREQKAGIAVNQGDLKLARATLDQMSAAESKTVQTMLQRYNIAMLLHDYDEADRAVAARAELAHREFLAPDSFFAAQVARARDDNEKARLLFFDAKQGLEARLRDYPQNAASGFWLTDLAEAEAALGHKAEALHAVEESLKSEIGNDPLERPSFLETRALVYCWLGQREEALQQLEELAKISNGVTYGDLRFGPQWDSLRGDPRFEKIVASLKPK